jgi:hypothetical protein
MKIKNSKLLVSALSLLTIVSAMAMPALAHDHHHDRNWNNRGWSRNHNPRANAFRRHHDGMTPGEVRDMRWNRRHR